MTFFEQINDLELIPGTSQFLGLDGVTSVAIAASGDHAVAVSKISTNDAINLFAPEPGAVIARFVPFFQSPQRAIIYNSPSGIDLFVAAIVDSQSNVKAQKTHKERHKT